MRRFLQNCFGKSKVQELPFVYVGAELSQKDDSSAALTQEDFTKNLKCLPTSPKLWAGRKEPFSVDNTKMRQCMLGELCWAAPVSPLDVCARFAKTPSRIDSLRVTDVHHTDDLARPAEEWQKGAGSEYASSSHPWRNLRFARKTEDDVCHRKRSRIAGRCHWWDDRMQPIVTSRLMGNAEGVMWPA